MIVHIYEVHFPLFIPSFTNEYINKFSILFWLQCYVDSLNELQQGLGECSNDDSSYDSDFGGDDDTNSTNFSHHDISRTTSDTLGAEYADYISAAAYKSRVDFALKLGYTERLVQAALNKLGAEPTQDQLLAVSINKINMSCLLFSILILFILSRS